MGKLTIKSRTNSPILNKLQTFYGAFKIASNDFTSYVNLFEDMGKLLSPIGSFTMNSKNSNGIRSPRLE